MHPGSQLGKCLIEVINDVIDVLDSNGQTYCLRCHSGLDKFLLFKLGMSRRRWVDRQGLGITDIGQV